MSSLLLKAKQSVFHSPFTLKRKGTKSWLCLCCKTTEWNKHILDIVPSFSFIYWVWMSSPTWKFTAILSSQKPPGRAYYVRTHSEVGLPGTLPSRENRIKNNYHSHPPSFWKHKMDMACLKSFPRRPKEGFILMFIYYSYWKSSVSMSQSLQILPLFMQHYSCTWQWWRLLLKVFLKLKNNFQRSKLNLAWQRSPWF